jgi:hypothetical protein
LEEQSFRSQKTEKAKQVRERWKFFVSYGLLMSWFQLHFLTHQTEAKTIKKRFDFSNPQSEEGNFARALEMWRLVSHFFV